MARLYSCGFELQSVTNGVEWDTTTNSPSINTTTTHGGLASLRCNPSATTAFIQQNLGVNLNNVDYSCRFYLYIATSTDGTEDIFKFFDGNNFNKAGLTLNSSNQLQLKWDGSAQGSLSDALQNNRWYRIEFRLTITSGAGDVAYGLIDGVQFGTYDGSGGFTTANPYFQLGVISSSTCDLYFDDIAVNSSDSSPQNGYPGEGYIIHLHPNAAGDNAADTGTFANIDEVTPNDTTDFIDLDTATSIGDYECEDLLVNTANINVVEIGVRLREEVSAITSYQLRIKSVSGGTVSTSTASDVGDTTWQTNPNATNQFNHRLVSYQTPDGSPWTITSINSMQIGVASLTVNNIDISTLWAMVEYSTPPIRVIKPLRPSIFVPSLAR